MCDKGYSSADLDRHITGNYGADQELFSRELEEDEEKHYPEEWTDKHGKKRLTCVCGHSLPCPQESTDHPAPDTEQS